LLEPEIQSFCGDSLPQLAGESVTVDFPVPKNKLKITELLFLFFFNKKLGKKKAELASDRKETKRNEKDEKRK
jgi:hypothetical protein